jgi:hypothetical protein
VNNATIFRSNDPEDPMKCDAYFDDAYTQPAYIAAGSALCAALRFTYRPALVAERSRLIAARRRLGPRESDRRLAEFTAARIVSWDLVDGLDQPLVISADDILRRRSEAVARLPAIVLGYSCSDIDPAWPDETRDEQFKFAAQAARCGRTVGEAREEHDEKNWQWG